MVHIKVSFNFISGAHSKWRKTPIQTKLVSTNFKSTALVAILGSGISNLLLVISNLKMALIKMAEIKVKLALIQNNIRRHTV